MIYFFNLNVVRCHNFHFVFFLFRLLDTWTGSWKILRSLRMCLTIFLKLFQLTAILRVLLFFFFFLCFPFFLQLFLQFIKNLCIFEWFMTMLLFYLLFLLYLYLFVDFFGNSITSFSISLNRFQVSLWRWSLLMRMRVMMRLYFFQICFDLLYFALIFLF